MSDTADRDQWDRQNRDEAAARAAQQASAGSMHRPVPAEQYTASSSPPDPRDAVADVAILAQEYERALRNERDIWLEVQPRLGGNDPQLRTRWNDWRDAVEHTERAARRLVNHMNARVPPDQA
jgi:hypothetical protein